MTEIKHIAHKNIDQQKWDKTILSSECPLVFAQAFYLNATSPGWDALIIGNYESIFPLTKKNKFGFNYLPQPSFTSQLGVFGKINNEVETLFYNYINKKFKLIEIELNAANKLNVKGTSIKKTYIIDYKTGYQYNQNSRRNIKKALDSGLRVERVEDKMVTDLSVEWMDPFLKSELKLSGPVIKTFNRLLQNSLKEKQCVTFKTVDAEKNIKALAHFISNGKHALYLKGMNADKTENTGAMHILMDTAINFFKGKAGVFDFGGGSKTSLATFYQGLGGTELQYKFLQVNRLPAIVNGLKRSRV